MPVAVLGPALKGVAEYWKAALTGTGLGALREFILRSDCTLHRDRGARFVVRQIPVVIVGGHAAQYW